MPNAAARIPTRLILAAVAALFSVPAPAFSMGVPYDEPMSIGSVLSYGVPTTPLRDGQWLFKISPGYTVEKKISDVTTIDLHGSGLSASLVYGFSEHWGATLLAAGNSMNGRASLQPSNVPNNLWGQLRGGWATGDDKGNGIMTAASLIWDHWSGDGFRLPVLVGLSYLKTTESTDNSAVGVKTEGGIDSPGIFLGIVPQFNVWRFRVAPFITWTDAFTASKTKQTVYNPSTGATLSTVEYTNTGNSDSRQTHAQGVSIEYRPWNLGFTYVPDMDGLTSYTLTWSKKFGAQ